MLIRSLYQSCSDIVLANLLQLVRGPLANHPGETPQAERRIRGRRVQASRKRLENERVAEEALTQKEIRGEASLTLWYKQPVIGRFRMLQQRLSNVD